MDKGERGKDVERSPLRRSVPLLVAATAILGIIAVLIASRQNPTDRHLTGIAGQTTATSQHVSEPVNSTFVSSDPLSYEEYLFQGQEEISDARLALSAEQLQQLSDLRQDSGNIELLMTESLRIESELQELLRTESASEQDILDKVNRLNETLSDLRSARARNVLEIRKILSPEQRGIALQIARESRAQNEPVSSTAAPFAEDQIPVDEYDEPLVDESTAE